MIRLSVHPQCPFLYCVDDTVVFPLNNTFSVHTTDQASCVEVATVRDIVLYWALNIANSAQTFTSCCSFPMIMMGVTLVFLLLVCKLTVATGALSGLVFYANIVGTNHAIFLPAKYIWMLFQSSLHG